MIERELTQIASAYFVSIWFAGYFDLTQHQSYLLKMGQPYFSFIFILLKETIQFLEQINVKKSHNHPVYGAGIRTHDLSNMSRLP